MKLSVLKLQTKTSIYKKFQRIHASKFKTENPIKFDRSVESSSTPITKPIPETIYAVRPKKPNLELSNSSKILIALFGEREFIKTYDKYRKQLKENKKHDKDTIASYKKVAPENEVRLKIRESELLEK